MIIIGEGNKLCRGKAREQVGVAVAAKVAEKAAAGDIDKSTNTEPGPTGIKQAISALSIRCLLATKGNFGILESWKIGS